MRDLGAIVIVLLIYSYPAVRARIELGSTIVPPLFAPDLTLYLNLSNIASVDGNQVLNPYYSVPVPDRGTGYLKFRFGATLFGRLDKLLSGRIWIAMFVWNIFWWALLCIAALWLFERFLPADSRSVAILGLGFLLFFNFGVLKTLLLAWIHLPSLTNFQSIDLPFMRAFIPQIPIAFLLAYLGLQMQALRRKDPLPWVAMALLQLLALSVFPYATLMMAGLTAVSVLSQICFGNLPGMWRIPLFYGIACAAVDAAFLRDGSVGFYATRSHLLHFQPALLPHLVGGNWLLLCLLTVGIALSKNFPGEIKWPLVGLGIANLILMLGDAIVPATTILLSHHAGHFLHMTTAVLLTFLVSSALSSARLRPAILRVALGFACALLLLNGVLLTQATYRQFLAYNRQEVDIARFLTSWKSMEGDLFIAHSLLVDDDCELVALISRKQVLFCTDAEVMLTPEQNRDIHRFRQAMYLYFTGKNSDYLRDIIRDPKSTEPLYRLGYWAETASLSPEERTEGLRSIQTDLLPWMERVENQDIALRQFFRQFPRIIVIDDAQKPVFLPSRLGSFLVRQAEQRSNNLEITLYFPQ
jgi:hypothetical protein